MIIIATSKYKAWRELHQLVSIFGCLFFFILSFTGLVLTFRPELSAMAQTQPLAGLLMYVMHILHTHLALGSNASVGGYFLAGIFSLVCVVMLVSGLAIYRPHALSCRAMREQSRRTGRLSRRYWVTFLHQELSAMTAVWGILLCFSGAWIAAFFILIMSGNVSPQIMATGGGAFGTGGMALQVGADAGPLMRLTQFMLAIHLHNHELFALRVLWAVWMFLFLAAATLGLVLLAKKQWGNAQVAVAKAPVSPQAEVSAGTQSKSVVQEETTPTRQAPVVATASSNAWSVWCLPVAWGVLTLLGLIMPLFGYVGSLLAVLCLLLPFGLLGYELYRA